MLDERTEFLICGHFDGTLRAEEESELQKRIADDPAARCAFEQHGAIDAALRSAQPPKADSGGLAGRISAAAGRLASAGESPLAVGVDGPTEEAIVALVSGELGADERAALEGRLADDPAARDMLRRHEALDALLRGLPFAPDVNHDALRDRILRRIDAADAPAAIPIGGFAIGRGLRLALAASVFMAVGLAAWLALRPERSAVRGEPLMEVVVAAPERAGGAPAVEVSISPSDELVRGQYDYYSTGLVAMPTRIEIQRSHSPLPRTDDRQ